MIRHVTYNSIHRDDTLPYVTYVTYVTLHHAVIRYVTCCDALRNLMLRTLRYVTSHYMRYVTYVRYITCRYGTSPHVALC